MAKNDWQKPHSDMGDMPLKEFRDPITGKRLNSLGEPRPEPSDNLSRDTTSGKNSNGSV